jgi:hypothetical protein
LYFTRDQNENFYHFGHDVITFFYLVPSYQIEKSSLLNGNFEDLQFNYIITTLVATMWLVATNATRRRAAWLLKDVPSEASVASEATPALEEGKKAGAVPLAGATAVLSSQENDIVKNA